MRWLTALLLVLTTLTAACGDDGGTSTDASRTTPAAAGTAAGQAAVQPRGELRIGASGVQFPRTIDASKDGYSLIFLGAAETLTRLSREGKVEPWLAERVTQVDPTTWQATLRKDATFHDGTPVTAEEVAASFRRSWEGQPAAARFIPKETQVTVLDPLTLQFKTPQPAGAFANNLATFQFAIARPGPAGSVLTGPYRPVKLETDQLLTLEAFAGHWAGPPPIARISVRVITDANARALALQSGDIDMALGLPPELVKGLPADVERAVTPSTRVDCIMFNHARPPFSDRAVREATSLAVDRATLNRVGLDGLGTVVTSIFPPNVGVEVVNAQATDQAKARQVLDAAGWRAGADGVRVKDGRRFAVTLLSYPGRGELTPMATVLEQQLKPLGYELKLEQIPSEKILDVLATGDFDATMYSFNVIPTGDPLYAFNQSLVPGALNNYGKYESARLNAVLDQLRVESDPARRQALTRQAQEVLRDDVPNAYIVATPVIYAYRKGKVQGFTPHPNDLYFLDRSISIQ
jgi:peptide/nickel transport system substrate-binding protein